MTREEIDDVVCFILKHDGPDGHIDGHELITAFVEAVSDGRGQDWADEYQRQWTERLANR